MCNRGMQQKGLYFDVAGSQWRGIDFKSGGTYPEFFGVPLHLFGSTNTISCFGERFRDVTLVSFFGILLSRCHASVSSHL